MKYLLEFDGENEEDIADFEIYRAAPELHAVISAWAELIQENRDNKLDQQVTWSELARLYTEILEEHEVEC